MPIYRDFNYVEGGWSPAPVCDYYTLEGGCGVRNFPLALQNYRWPAAKTAVSYCLNNRDCAPSMFCEPGYGVGTCVQRKQPVNNDYWMERPLRWL